VVALTALVERAITDFQVEVVPRAAATRSVISFAIRSARTCWWRHLARFRAMQRASAALS
jgi:hypothetical protein